MFLIVFSILILLMIAYEFKVVFWDVMDIRGIDDIMNSFKTPSFVFYFIANILLIVYVGIVLNVVIL